MARLPYDLVAIEANKLLSKILSARSMDEMTAFYNEYINYLEATGWSSTSFDSETLKRVDANWDTENKELN
jgi:hypothetical protein